MACWASLPALARDAAPGIRTASAVRSACSSRWSRCCCVMGPLMASSVSIPGMNTPPGMTVAGSPPEPLRTVARRPDCTASGTEAVCPTMAPPARFVKSSRNSPAPPDFLDGGAAFGCSASGNASHHLSSSAAGLSATGNASHQFPSAMPCSFAGERGRLGTRKKHCTFCTQVIAAPWCKKKRGWPIGKKKAHTGHALGRDTLRFAAVQAA